MTERPITTARRQCSALDPDDSPWEKSGLKAGGKIQGSVAWGSLRGQASSRAESELKRGRALAGASRGEGSMEGIIAVHSQRKSCWLCPSSSSLFSTNSDILW